MDIRTERAAVENGLRPAPDRLQFTSYNADVTLSIFLEEVALIFSDVILIATTRKARG